MGRSPERIAEHWQREAHRQQARKNTYKADAIRAEANLRIWKYGAIAMTATALALAITLVFAGQRTTREKRDNLEWIAVPRVSASSEKRAPTPAHILASVHVGGCSGTVVSRGEKGAVVLSAFHCVGHRVGQTYRLHHPDGSEVNAVLVDVDSSHDLAKFKIPAEGVLGISQVPEAMPASDEIGAYEVVGYPNGEGPKYFRLSQPRDNNVSSIPGLWRWTFDVDHGNIYGGNSGCGVFVNGKLCGVLSHRDETNNGKTLYCCPHEHLISFCKKRFKGDNDCGNGICPVPKRDEAPPAPAPTPKKNHSGWTPKPNVPIVLPEKEADEPAENQKPYDGKGKQPDDLRSPRKKSIEIDKLRKGKQDEPAPEAPELPAPAPPAIDAALHGKVDSLTQKLDQFGANLPVPLDPSKLTGDVVNGVKAELPKILSGHLDPVEQRLKDEIAGHGLDPSKLVKDLKGAVVPELPGIGKQIASDIGPQLKTGLAAHLSSILPGMLPAISSAAPGLLGMAGAIGGPAGIGLGLAAWLLSRSLKKQSGVLGSQTGVLAALVAHVANSKQPHSGPPDPSGSSPPPPLATVDPGIQNLFAAVNALTDQLKKTSPQSSPAQAGAQTTSPAPFSWQSILPISVADPIGEAMQQATAEILKRQPNISLLGAQPHIQQLAQTILNLRPPQHPVGSTTNLAS